MELMDGFISSLDFSNHPMKNAKYKIKEQYYYLLNLFIEGVHVDNYRLHRLKQYENFLMRKDNKSNEYITPLENSKISFSNKTIISKYKFLRKKYKYCMLCDLALILLNDKEIENILQDIYKYVSSYRKNQLEKLYKILIKPNSKTNKFSFVSNIIEQYWKNKEFIKKKEVKIIVTANMSAGKSTLINALVGKKITRTAQEVCTTNNYYIFNKAFEDNKMYLEESNLIVDAKKEDLDKCKYDTSISVATFFRKLNNDIERVCIVDTPGVNSAMNKIHGKITKETIKKENYDILLYILNANKLGTDEEIAYLKWIAKNVQNKKVLFVLNKLDTFHTEEDSIKDSINGVKNDLISLGYEDPIICPLSAYYAFLLKKKYYDNSFTEDEEDEYYIYTKKFKKDEYDLSKYYKEKYKAINEFNSMSIKCGIYNLERMIYGGIK